MEFREKVWDYIKNKKKEKVYIYKRAAAKLRRGIDLYVMKADAEAIENALAQLQEEEREGEEKGGEGEQGGSKGKGVVAEERKEEKGERVNLSGEERGGGSGGCGGGEEKEEEEESPERGGAEFSMKPLSQLGWRAIDDGDPLFACAGIKANSRGFQVCYFLKKQDQERWVQEWKKHIGMEICSNDPGVRTFGMIYDPCYARLIRAYDGLAKGSDRRHKKRYRQVQAWSSAENLPEAFKEDLHFVMGSLTRKHTRIMKRAHTTLASFMSRYSMIFQPDFATKGMVGTENRSISKRVTRQMSSLQFYKFKGVLARMTRNAQHQLLIVDESFTTQWCGGCGTLTKQGSRKVRICQGCRCSADRDGSASRAIFIKSIVAWSYDAPVFKPSPEVPQKKSRRTSSTNERPPTPETAALSALKE